MPTAPEGTNEGCVAVTVNGVRLRKTEASWEEVAADNATRAKLASEAREAMLTMAQAAKETPNGDAK